MSFIRFLLFFAATVAGQKSRNLVAGPLWKLLSRGQSHDLMNVGIKGPEDLTLIYAGQRMAHDRKLEDYHVPPGCKVMIAIETAKLFTKPDPDSAYWN